ncbi:MAG: sigma 54-interacting transcriptional regulator [Clostridiales Family XIII bacterium]|nr:sigma 54-interacting transcriptional regulator [Clostridiales Family XIII bacterium]
MQTSQTSVTKTIATDSPVEYNKSVSPTNADTLDIRELGDAFRVSLAVFNADGKFVYMNRSFARECGVNADEAIGKDESFISPNPTMLTDVFLYRRMICHPVRRMDGFVFITAIPIFHPNGSIRYVGMTMENEASLNEIRRSFQGLVENTEGSVQIKSHTNEQLVFRPLLGRHASMRELREFIRQIGPSSASVLITGESGCGKEIAADCIQALSDRSTQPYVKINCAAIPESLLESELFGYEPGSFTGADSKGKPGLLEEANGGTLFLDEISDMSPLLQPKLLRVLQHGESYRIGSTKTQKTDVRLITATNADLHRKITEGKFREDLYYRIAVIPIRVPALRERRSDIFMLASYYLTLFCEKYNKNLTISPEVEALLTQYHWPGNIRELQNVMEYYVVCSASEAGLDCRRLRQLFRHSLPEASASGSSLEYRISAYEKQLIEETLSDGISLRQAAKRLALDASTLSRKARKYGIKAKRS